MAAVASIFVASTPSTITISGSEQSDFFSNPVDPSDYSITLGFDLNRWFNTLTLGPLPITDNPAETSPAVGDENLVQGLSNTSSDAGLWYTRLRELKQGVNGGAGWGDMKDDDSANLLASTQMIVFKNRMEHVLNSLFGTSTVSNTRPLRSDKIKEWLEQAGRFEADVFTSEQFTFLRSMFVHAEKYDTITRKLKLEVGDKMGVVVEISTTEADAAVNMITVNLFIEQELDEVLAASDYADAAASAAAGASGKAGLLSSAPLESTTVSSAYQLTQAAIQYGDDAIAAYGDAQAVTGLMLRYASAKQGFVDTAATSSGAATVSTNAAKVSFSQIVSYQANDFLINNVNTNLQVVIGYKDEALAAEVTSDFVTASEKAMEAGHGATRAEIYTELIRGFSDKAQELAPGLADTIGAANAATNAESDALSTRAAADLVTHLIQDLAVFAAQTAYLMQSFGIVSFTT